MPILRGERFIIFKIQVCSSIFKKKMTHQRLVTKSSHSDIKATAVADSGLRLWSDHHVPGLQLTTECQDWRRQPISHQNSTGMTGSAGSFQVSGFRTEQSSDCQTSNEELMLTQVGTSGPVRPGLALSRPQSSISLVMAASNQSIRFILLAQEKFTQNSASSFKLWGFKWRVTFQSRCLLKPTGSVNLGVWSRNTTHVKVLVS